MNNEAGRALALLITLVLNSELVGTNAKKREELKPIVDELAAFAGLFAHRSRSAANFHLSSRGKAILELGPDEALAGGPQGQDLTLAYNELRDRVALMEKNGAINPT